jgi:hypothetical protein
VFDVVEKDLKKLLPSTKVQSKDKFVLGQFD